MCAYKLVTIKFKWWGLQSKVENFIQKVNLFEGWDFLPVLGVEGGGADLRSDGKWSLVAQSLLIHESYHPQV